MSGIRRDDAARTSSGESDDGIAEDVDVAEEVALLLLAELWTSVWGERFSKRQKQRSPVVKLEILELGEIDWERLRP